MGRNSNKTDDFSRVKSGEKVDCPRCRKGFFVTQNPDVRKALVFHCNNCGETLEFVPQIDLFNL